MRALWCFAVVAACSTDPPAAQPDAGAPIETEEQYRRALQGHADTEVERVRAAFEADLTAGERAALAERDFEASTAFALLTDLAFMKAWGLCARELAGVVPLHGFAHAECELVESQLAGWTDAAGGIMSNEIGASIPGDEHAAAAMVFIAKKVALGFAVTVDKGFDYGNHCAGVYAEDGGTACGGPGETCCDGDICEGGTTCLGGLCL